MPTAENVFATLMLAAAIWAGSFLIPKAQAIQAMKK